MERFRHWLIALLLVALSLAVFWQVRDYEFVWDDNVNITDNPHLRQVMLSKVGHFWQKPYAGLYIPLTYTVWATLAGFAELPATDEGVAKFNPRPFHTVNIVLHLLSVLVVFFILRMLLNSDWGACGGAFLFALHPVQVEPVAWVTGMKDLLSGFLSLVAVWQYLAYAKAQALRTERRAWRYCLALVAYGLAVLSKPVAVVVPVVAWVLDYWVVRRPLRQSAVALIPWIFIAVPVMVVTKWVQPDIKIDFIPPLWTRFLVAADALTFYLSKLVLPLWLGPDYGRLPGLVLQGEWAYIAWIIPFGLAVLIWLWRERSPYLVAGAGIFVVGILPVVGLVPFEFQAISTVADRYLYLSMLGPTLAVAWLLSEHKGKMIMVLYIVYLGLLTIASASQTRYWRDNGTLFNHALKINPNSWIAYDNVGVALAGLGKLGEAMEHYRQALRINPRHANTHYNLGLVLAKQRKIDEAIEHYLQALKINPADAKAHNNLGLALVERGQFEEAIKHYRQALRINPSHGNARYNLGVALAKVGKVDEAAGQYRQALQIDPTDAEAHNNLAVALAKEGKLDESINHLYKALELKSSAGVRSETHFYLGTALAKQDRLDESVEHFQQALKIKPDFAEVYHYLGRVVAAQGDLNRAIGHFREALRIQPEFAQAHQSLGQALAEQGKTVEAAKHFQEALRITKSRSSGTRSIP